MAFLVRRNIPIEKWPPKLIAKAVAGVKKDFGTLDTRAKNEGRSAEEYKAEYVRRFHAFAGAKLPPEIQAVLDGAV